MYRFSRSRIANEIMVTHSAFSLGFSVWAISIGTAREMVRLCSGLAERAGISSVRAITEELNRQGINATRGRAWHPTAVARLDRALDVRQRGDDGATRGGVRVRGRHDLEDAAPFRSKRKRVRSK